MELIILFLYDQINDLFDLVKETEGITLIHIKDKNNDDRYKSKGIPLNELPLFIIYYGDTLKYYPANQDTFNQIKNKLDMLIG